MRHNPVLITVVIVVSISLLYFASYLNTFSRIIARNIKPFGNHHYRRGLLNEISADTFYLYRAYIYESANNTAIRVLSINQCIEPDWILKGVVNRTEVRLRPQTIEGSCPWRWAPGCRYNSYVFDGVMSTKNKSNGANQITLLKDEKVLTLPLRWTPSKAKDTLNVCVPPIYWKVSCFPIGSKSYFSWRHGKLKVLIMYFLYYHSSTRNVRKVLNDYEEEGFVTVIPWPSLPKSHIVDPNTSLYRLAHSLAHNDCVLRIGSEFGALVDIDELIIPRNKSLLSFVIQQFDDPSVGQLSFTHRSLQLLPSLATVEFAFESLDFSGIFNATESTLPGPSKVPITEAVLLHYRYNHFGGENPTPVRLAPDGSSTYDLQIAMISRVKRVFPHAADFHYKTQSVLGICLKPWRESQNQCKTPISSCKRNLTDLEDWYFIETTDGFLPL